MLNIFYNISPKLKECLSEIEALRKQILLNPISPKTEFRLRWEAAFNRIYSSLKLSGNPLGKKEMLKALTEITFEKMNFNETEIVKYKKAQDHIFQNWLGSDDPIDALAIINLHKIIGTGKLRVPRAGLQYLLDYLQVQAKSENPIIMAGIMNIEMGKMRLFSDHNAQISLLSPLLFLCKYGYDFKGFLAYETEWMKNSDNYKENYTRALRSFNLTLWLEYFAGCILKQLTLIKQSIEKPRYSLPLKESFLKLNERQKSILSYLDQPQTSIVNRQIQKRYKTSQVTAARDLAKLTNLGFLFSHGKGRSVYYTKI